MKISTERVFPLGVLLTGTTGVMLCEDGFGDFLFDGWNTALESLRSRFEPDTQGGGS